MSSFFDLDALERFLETATADQAGQAADAIRDLADAVDGAAAELAATKGADDGRDGAGRRIPDDDEPASKSGHLPPRRDALGRRTRDE